MHMASSVFRYGLLLTALLGAVAAHGAPIALPSAQGQALLARAEQSTAFWRLLQFHTNQVRRATCAVASGVTALNALGIEGPPVEGLSKQKWFTLDNFLSPAAQRIRTQEQVFARGYPLLEWAQVLRTLGADVRAVPVDSQQQLDAVRRDLRAYLDDPDAVVMVQFSRVALGLKSGGHCSPLGGYDAQSDRFLLMDVGNYVRPFAWIEAQALFEAMQMLDPDGNVPRGYLIVRKPAGIQALVRP
jgi:hypothetical protein